MIRSRCLRRIAIRALREPRSLGYARFVLLRVKQLPKLLNLRNVLPVLFADATDNGILRNLVLPNATDKSVRRHGTHGIGTLTTDPPLAHRYNPPTEWISTDTGTVIRGRWADVNDSSTGCPTETSSLGQPDSKLGVFRESFELQKRAVPQPTGRRQPLPLHRAPGP